MAGTVQIKEKDFTLAVSGKTSVSTAFVGPYSWGPVNDPFALVAGQRQFTKIFGKSNKTNQTWHMMVKDHIRTIQSVWINRAAGPLAANATANGIPLRADNAEQFGRQDENGAFDGNAFIGRYPGSTPNGMEISTQSLAGFADWKHARHFEYPPEDDKFHIVVIDTNGTVTGNPARQQMERISLSVDSSSAVMNTVTQEETLTITVPGTVPAWSSQTESVITLSFTGAVGTDGDITVLGQTIPVVVADSLEVIAQKAFNVLFNTDTYKQVVKSSTNVIVTMQAKGPIDLIADDVSQGVTTKATISQGYSRIQFKYAEQYVTYNYDVWSATPDHAAGIASVLNNVVDNNISLKTGKALVAAGVITVKRAKDGPITPLQTESVSGILITQATTTPGKVTVPISYEGFNGTIDLTADFGAVKVPAALKSHIETLPNVESTKYEDKNLIVTRVGKKSHKSLSAKSDNGIAINNQLLTPGYSGQVLEKFESMTTALGKKNDAGLNANWKAVVNDRSDYIWAVDEKALSTERNDTFTLKSGVDDYNIIQGPYWETYKKKKYSNVRCVVAYSTEDSDLKAAVDMAETRMDCVAYYSVPRRIIFGDVDVRATKAKTWVMDQLGVNSSYSFIDSGWGQLFNEDTGEYTWLPMAGGTAAMVNKLFQTGEWHQAPANIDRGSYEAYRSIAWEPTIYEEKILDEAHINTVKRVDGGLALMGNFMTYFKNSAFNRLNTRNTFIYIEQAIAELAKYFLFELHNQITAKRFENAVVPFLNNLVGSKIERAKWIGDDRVNSGQDKVEHRFNGVCLIGTYYTVELIEISFAGVRPDTSFQEIEDLI